MRRLRFIDEKCIDCSFRAPGLTINRDKRQRRRTQTEPQPPTGELQYLNEFQMDLGQPSPPSTLATVGIAFRTIRGFLSREVLLNSLSNRFNRITRMDFSERVWSWKY